MISDHTIRNPRVKRRWVVIRSTKKIIIVIACIDKFSDTAARVGRTFRDELGQVVGEMKITGKGWTCNGKPIACVPLYGYFQETEISA